MKILVSKDLSVQMTGKKNKKKPKPFLSNVILLSLETHCSLRFKRLHLMFCAPKTVFDQLLKNTSFKDPESILKNLASVWLPFIWELLKMKLEDILFLELKKDNWDILNQLKKGWYLKKPNLIINLKEVSLFNLNNKSALKDM